MAIVQRIDGSFVEGVRLTDISAPDEEGSRSATAHFGDETRPVYKSIIDGFKSFWIEQMTIEEWREHRKSQVPDLVMQDHERISNGLVEEE